MTFLIGSSFAIKIILSVKLSPINPLPDIRRTVIEYTCPARLRAVLDCRHELSSPPELIYKRSVR